MKIYFRVCLFLQALLLTSCSNEVVPLPSLIAVKFIGNEDFVAMERIEGGWSKRDRVAELQAYGYQFEHFRLFLSNVQDTGYYPKPTIQNISYSDGLDFAPFKVLGGYIRITQLDSSRIGGHFEIYLEDNFNGYDSRGIVGSFGIKSH